MQWQMRHWSKYLDVANDPLYPFGYGLCYTSFQYSELRVDTPKLGLDGTLVVRATVTNRGPRAGEETVQLYVRDLVGSVTRPVKELKGFQRLALEPGGAGTVRFEVPVQELGFHGLDMAYVVEPGDYKVWVGPNAATGLEGAFRVVG
jgi:beta-glucosidase